MNKQISVVIIAKNEAKNIVDCIQSALSFAGEVIVVDDFSDDQTVRLSEELGAKVYQRAMNGNWGEQQTFAIEQASMDWLFLLDCDERITIESAKEIKAKVAQEKAVAYYIPRKNYFIGRLVRYGGWYPDYNIRLLPRESSWVEGRVHPKIMHRYKTAKLKWPMIHFTYNSWDQYLGKQNRYSSLAAEKNYENGKKAKVIRDFVLRPLFAFVKKYIFQSGFRDGWLGFVLANNYANYTLNKYVKLYQLQQNSGKQII